MPLGLDQARMDAVDLHAVGLAEIGEAFGEGGDRGIDRAADGEALRRGLRPLVPPIAINEPRRSLSSGQAARASRTWAKNFSA